MIFRPNVKFCTPVCQHSQNRYVVLLKKRYHSVIEDIGRGYCMFGGVQLLKGHPGVSINNSLLINPTDTFDRANEVCVVGNQVAKMLGFDFTVSILFLFLTFHGDHLGFSMN